MGRGKTKKPLEEGEVEPWAKSEAEPILCEAIIAGDILKEWDAEFVQQLHEKFQDYKLSNFKTNLKSLREAIAKDYEHVSTDSDAFWHDEALLKELRTMNPLPPPPYPLWNTHRAKKLLEEAIDNKEHEKKSPKALWQSKPEYKEFPLDVFRNHIYQAVSARSKKQTRFDKKKMRAMAVKPRDTVLTEEEIAKVKSGGALPTRFLTEEEKEKEEEEKKKKAIEDKKKASKSRRSLNTQLTVATKATAKGENVGSPRATATASQKAATTIESAAAKR